ncbi:MAG: divergent PAP2 family protein [Kiritimatiellia bacterium]|jgi:acid phosphatase family membrane protein YuiD
MEIQSVKGFSTNLWFFCAFFSWCLAQCTKMAIAFIKTRSVDLRYLKSTGGMPSAHSATVSGLATSIGLTEGFGSPIFALATTYAVITMFDASTVRRAAGLQAALLNEIVREIFKGRRLRNKQRLKELLGHTRFEVFMGMLLGIAFSATACVLWINRLNGA